MILDSVDTAGFKEHTGEARGKHLNTLKGLRIGADEREEGGEIGIKLVASEVHLMADAFIGTAVKVAHSVVIVVAIIIVRLAEDGNYIILRFVLTTLSNKTKRNRYRGLGHIVLLADLGRRRLNFYIFQFFLIRIFPKYS